jgi:hypothetical protein
MPPTTIFLESVGILIAAKKRHNPFYEITQLAQNRGSALGKSMG